MRSNDVHEVTDGSLHWLPSCPCRECEDERERRRPARPSHLVHISVEAAHLFGFISRRSPMGSLARSLSLK
jgi:hypothetical protein